MLYEGKIRINETSIEDLENVRTLWNDARSWPSLAFRMG